MRNSVDEQFVEGTCNVFVVNVCVVLECYGGLDPEQTSRTSTKC